MSVSRTLPHNAGCINVEACVTVCITVCPTLHGNRCRALAHCCSSVQQRHDDCLSIHVPIHGEVRAVPPNPASIQPGASSQRRRSQWIPTLASARSKAQQAMMRMPLCLPQHAAKMIRQAMPPRRHRNPVLCSVHSSQPAHHRLMALLTNARAATILRATAFLLPMTSHRLLGPHGCGQGQCGAE